uniref:Uncharacterized protein n=1 Tax=Cyprinus carpio carpio TaxID=630221 RepID=A0A9J8DEX6_CYPCA
MPPRVDDVMKLCCELSANQQVKTAVKQSGKGAAAAGGLAFAGGLIGGPLGIAVGESIHALHTAYNLMYSVICDAGVSYLCFCLFKGGAVGGLIGCWMTSGQFKPLPQVLMELTPDQRHRLFEDIVTILGSITWTDVAQLTALVMGNATLQQQVTAALLSYIQKELQAEVRYVD